MKLPVIGDKEIIPVRLIPFIANAWLGQVTLAGILANKVRISGWPYPSDSEQIEVSVRDEKTDCVETIMISRAELIGQQKRDNGIAAYHLNDDNEPVLMRASEWETIFREISVIEPLMRNAEKKNGVTDSMESTWRLKVTEVLPPGVFLWRNDFEALWEAHIKSFTTIPSSTELPDFRKVNYDAYIRPQYHKLVWEGFEYLQSNSISIKLTERKNNLPDRKDKLIPENERRKKAEFTQVMESIFARCIRERNTEILQQHQIDAFLRHLSKLADDNKNEKIENDKRGYAELVEEVKSGSNGGVLMRNPKKKGGGISRKDRWYPKSYVSKKLTELRKTHPDIFSK